MFISYIFRSHDDAQQLNVGGLDNPSYEQTIIQSTQSNGNTQGTELPEDQYSIPVNIKSKTITSNSQVNDTSGDVHFFIYQDDIQMEGIYSLVMVNKLEKVCIIISKGIEKKTQELVSN